MNRFRNICSHIERYLVTHSFGEVPADFLHGFFHAFCYFHSVGSRQHIDGQYRRILFVDGTLGVIRLCFERDAGHITQTDDGTVGIGTDYDFLKLAYGRQTSLGSDGNGHVQSLYRLLSQYTGCRFAVLVFQCVLQVGHGQAEIGQFVGLYPYLHGVIAASDV